jgi:uncharacterized protein (TIGR02391 family)
MAEIAPFELAVIEGVAQAVGDAYTGSKITGLLAEAGAKNADPGPQHTKWRRIAHAVSKRQVERQSGAVVVNLVAAAAKPARWATEPAGFEEFTRAVNVPLAFAGLEVRDDGLVRRRMTAKTVADVAQLTRRMRSELERRGGHSEVFKYCTEELLAEDCFGSVFEGIKGLATRIRSMASTDEDGSALIDAVFLGSAPIILFNRGETVTEKSEQSGLANIMKGLFSAFRNPAAHEPRILWHISEEDAIDLLTTVSLLHRRLDRATVQRP